MSTAKFIILQSLTRIGKNSPLKKAKAADISAGLSSLQSFMEMLGTMRIILPTNPVRGSSDELGETLDTRNALIDNLAIEIATNYDNGQVIVSETLAVNAAKGMAFLKTYYRNSVALNKVPGSTLPVGAGRARGIKPRIYFNGVTPLVDAGLTEGDLKTGE